MIEKSFVGKATIDEKKLYMKAIREIIIRIIKKKVNNYYKLDFYG